MYRMKGSLLGAWLISVTSTGTVMPSAETIPAGECVIRAVKSYGDSSFRRWTNRRIHTGRNPISTTNRSRAATATTSSQGLPLGAPMLRAAMTEKNRAQ